MVSMETRDMLPYQPSRSLQPNPEGLAALGAVVGLMVGGGVGAIISAIIAPKKSVSAIGDSPENALASAGRQAQELDLKLRRWNRWSHVINGTLATAGAGFGARLGALPHQKDGAMWGAIIGVGSMRLINVAFNPAIGLPGLVTGGVGAYIGARGAF
jgi:uncharacterized membrane protein